MNTHIHLNAPANPYALGVGLAVMTIVPGILLPESVTLTLLALLLFGIAAVYFGFAVADGRRTALLIEGSVVLFYLALTAIGLTVSTWVLVAGYVLHGFWDLLHHNSRFGANVAGWYIPFCVVYDWLIAGFMVVLLVT